MATRETLDCIFRSPLRSKGDLLGFDGSAHGRLPVAATDGWALVVDAASTYGFKWAAVAGTGTVTSVGVSVPAALLTVASTPVTTSGTIALALATQSANRLFAGPTSGSAATPTFRAIVAADLGTGTGSSSNFLRGDLTWAAPAAATLTFTGNVTGTGTTTIALTIANQAVQNAMFRDSVALSVVGRSGNSAGSVGDIQSSSDDTLLRRTSSTLSWGQLTVGMLPDAVLTYAKVQNVTGSRLTGRYSASAGVMQEISIGSGLALNSTTGVLSATGGSGTVTSVGVSVPSNFSVSSSPVTTSGTIAIAWNVTAGNLLVGAGTSAMTALAPGAAGAYVRSNGSAWVRSVLLMGDLPGGGAGKPFNWFRWTGGVGDRRWLAGAFGSPSLSGDASNLDEDTIYLIPVYEPYGGSIDLFEINVMATGATGATLRLGVYSASDRAPNSFTLVNDAGDIPTDSGGYQEIAASVTLNVGTLYFIAVGTLNDALVGGGRGHIQLVSSAGVIHSPWGMAAGGNQHAIVWKAPWTPGALPASISSGAPDDSGIGAPAIKYRLAS